MTKMAKMFITAAVFFSTTTLGHALPTALQSYTLIDISDNYGEISDTVSTGHDIFAFEALAGDLITLDIDVTGLLPDTIFGDDDSRLFLLNDLGELLDYNDDFDGLQSRIKDFLIADEGMYFAGVTTYGNLPLFDSSGVISGWEDDGLSGFEYDFKIMRERAGSAVPEPSTFALSLTGLMLLFFFRYKTRRLRFQNLKKEFSDYNGFKGSLRGTRVILR